jgi:hypothetical protein
MPHASRHAARGELISASREIRQPQARYPLSLPNGRKTVEGIDRDGRKARDPYAKRLAPSGARAQASVLVTTRSELSPLVRTHGSRLHQILTPLTPASWRKVLLSCFGSRARGSVMRTCDAFPEVRRLRSRHLSFHLSRHNHGRPDSHVGSVGSVGSRATELTRFAVSSADVRGAGN